ncbi:MAG: DUF1365 domain-containing protein [Proteobacteria bacterium]|nr:DUF1365 domain-containing protein [Pseudomonadota bacterium]
MKSIELGIVAAKVGHTRLKPFVYSYNHRVSFLVLDIEKIKLLNSFKLISLNKFNFFSFLENDHQFKSEKGYKIEIAEILKEHQIKSEAKRVLLITIPRMLGYAFKPVSFWCCLDKEDRLFAVLAEVNNTFKERHVYLCYSQDESEITAEKKLILKKVFHVSPFFDIQGNYQFSFDIRVDYINIKINYLLEEEIVLTTYLKGELKTLSDSQLFKTLLLSPLMTLKVILLIHFHALRLWFKGAKYRPKPNLPKEKITT